MRTITDAEVRLRAWVRDFGGTAQPAFVADLAAVLDECEALRECFCPHADRYGRLCADPMTDEERAERDRKRAQRRANRAPGNL